MGNLKSRLKNIKTIDDYPHLKNPEDVRPDSEISITNKLSFLLSDLNINRVQGRVSSIKKDWNQYTFVCLHGFPVNHTEFDFLQLPGKTLFFSPFGFQKKHDEKTEEEKVYDVFHSDFQNDTKRFHELLREISDQKIILVYHSFGSFILGMYLREYGVSQLKNLKGMIEISGSPLRYYIAARNLGPIILMFEFNQLWKEADNVHELFQKQMQKVGFSLQFQNKEETLSFLRYLYSQNYGQLFESSWNYPNVLKLLIYGRKDSLFETALINEKAIYYCYRKENSVHNEKQLIEKFKSFNQLSKTINNIQEKFIFAIPNGQHSLHHNDMHQSTIKKAVQEYLQLIYE